MRSLSRVERVTVKDPNLPSASSREGPGAPTGLRRQRSTAQWFSVSLPQGDKKLFSYSTKCCVVKVTTLIQTGCFGSSPEHVSIVLILEGFSGDWRDDRHAPSAC